jgi:hypothetical protein
MAFQDKMFRTPPGLSLLDVADSSSFKGSQQTMAGRESNSNNWNVTAWNPWLWPTDASMEEAGIPASFQMFQKSWLESNLTDEQNYHSLFGTSAEFLSEEDGWQAIDSQVFNSDDEGKESSFGKCRWHRSAETVGVISNNGHVFTKTAGPRRSRISDHGAKVELASICMVFDSSLRCGGLHRYCYQIMDGEMGAADGAGFVFDSKVRRNNIQKMRSVFLNQRGRICLRNNQQVTKLDVQLPRLTVGVSLTLIIDLDSMMAYFDISNSEGVPIGSANVSLESLFDQSMSFGAGKVSQLRSGFFCAVVTGSITVGIQ